MTIIYNYDIAMTMTYHITTADSSAAAHLWAKQPAPRCPPSRRSCLTVQIDPTKAARHSSRFDVVGWLDWDFHHAGSSKALEWLRNPQFWMVWKFLERDVKGIAMVDDA